jgi:hypothetical protein
MTDPLIVVEGSLRLPSVRLLGDSRLRFGREWLPARNRPVRSRSETPLFAARLHTGYVEAVSLSDRQSPYRAASIWGVFADGPVRQSMLRLMESVHADANAQAEPTGAAADPILLSVRAPNETHHHDGQLPKTLKAAVALACAALIAWLLFGHEQHVGDDTPAAAKEGDSLQGKTGPASAPVGASVAASVAASMTASVAAARNVAAASSMQTAAPQAPASGPVRTVVASGDAASAKPVAIQTQTAPLATTRASGTPLVSSSSQAGTKAAKRTAHAMRTQTAATPRGTYKISRSKATHRTRITSNDYADADSASTAARPRWNRTPYNTQAGTYRRDTQATKTSVTMDTKSLYDMLQHSPTLDSNVR